MQDLSQGSTLTQPEIDLVLSTIMIMRMLSGSNYVNFEEAYKKGFKAGEEKMRTKVRTLAKLLGNV